MRVVYIKKLREERWYIRRTWNELELNVTKRLSLIGKSMCYEWGGQSKYEIKRTNERNDEGCD